MPQLATISQISAEITAALPPFPPPKDGPLFYAYGARKEHHALVDTSQHLTLSDDLYHQALTTKTKGFGVLPLVIDVETQSEGWEGFWTHRRFRRREGITIQCMGIAGGTPRIFEHPQQALYAARTEKFLRHPVALQEEKQPGTRERGGVIYVDYLRAELGPQHTIGIHHAPWHVLNTLPKLQIGYYGHYLLAELYMHTTGQFLSDIDARVRAKEIALGRRLAASQKRNDRSTSDNPFDIPHDYVTLPHVLTIDNWQFAVELFLCDTAALHGPISLENLANNVGLEMKYKSEVKREWITKMRELYWKHPALFDAYALDDLIVYHILLANQYFGNQMYTELGLGSYCPSEPKRTKGKDAQLCYQAMVEKKLHILPGTAGKAERDAMLALMERGTATYLTSLVHSTIKLLGKVEGGRCRNCCPTLAYLLGPLADIDISSCYGKGLALQTIPLGTPLIGGFDISPYNEYPTLRQWRKMLGKELVPGLWHARVSLPDSVQLTYPQNFLGSWFDYKDEDTREQLMNKKDGMIDDRDQPINALTVRSGCLKILRKEVRDAVITSDFLEWLDHVCTPKARAELLDKLQVKSFLVYLASERRDTLADLERDRPAPNTTHKNTCTVAKIKGIWTLNRQNQDYYGWIGLPLGELGVDKLLQLRKEQPKGCPLDQLLKLTINALYGDSVSQYFDTSNMCVGNCITARARAMAWYMEKGLRLVQTITDGGCFALNAILAVRTQQVFADNVVDVMRMTPKQVRHQLGLDIKPLGNWNNLTLSFRDSLEKHPVFNHHIPQLHFWRNGEEVDICEGKAALQWIDETALAHLQTLFPHTTVLKQFTFETKMTYDWGVFHGGANYHLHHPDSEQCVTKMRSYERDKEYETFEWIDNKLVRGDWYKNTTPAKSLLLPFVHADAVPRQHAFGRDGILKDGTYRTRTKQEFNPDDMTILCPGDDSHKCGIPCEFNLSTYHFCTKAQFKAIKKQWQTYKRKYGQYVEMLYLNADGTLNYAQMIADVDKAIIAGEMDLMEALDPNSKQRRQLGHRMYHPAKRALDEARAAIASAEGYGPQHDFDAIEEDDIHIETSWDHQPYEDYEAAD